jgi:hypothetical protein
MGSRIFAQGQPQITILLRMYSVRSQAHLTIPGLLVELCSYYFLPQDDLSELLDIKLCFLFISCVIDWFKWENV